MANKFKPGDHVELTVGGPVMVVDAVLGDGDVYRCVWFAGKKHEHGNFKEATLKAAAPE